MKFVFRVLLLTILFINFNVFGQLNNDAKLLMNTNPDTYQSIRILSLNKYSSNNQLVSQEINKQCNAYWLLINNNNINTNLLIAAVSANTYQKDKFKILFESGKIEQAMSLVIDWVRVSSYYNENIPYYRY
mgnify:FL=1|tara:strand:+ start:67 stop:459 length:393 start_codon:yes stop_codon:yes gene_type:complete